MVNFVNNKGFMALLFLIPAIIVGLIISATGNWSPAPDPEKGIVFSNFMGIVPIQVLFTPALLFGLVVGVLGVKKFWADMKTANGVTSGDLKGSVIDTVKDVMSHDKFKQCDVSRDRFTSHFLMLYSFIALGIATGLGVVYIDILGLHSPFSFGYGTPIKIFGNLGAIAIIAGTLLMINDRFKNASKVGVGSYFDWLLIGTIGVVGISGFLAQLLRIAGVGSLAYTSYFIHLVFVFALFVYLPYSKLAHMFYRGAAMAFNRYSGREAQAQQSAAAPVEASQPEAETKQEPEQE
jgi:quinone-modifying oxidoreductase subunit QmoC